MREKRTLTDDLLRRYERIGDKINLLHIELSELNRSIEAAPELIEKGLIEIPNTNYLARLIQIVEDRNDSLTDEYIRHLELMQKLTDCILRNA